MDRFSYEGGNLLSATVSIEWEQFDAVLFDMDGVLTDSASIHAACWKRMFDAYLQERSERYAEELPLFSIARDYKAYVDGKLRYDGVRSFLASRGIELPEGVPEDCPERETVCGLGNRKDAMVSEVLAREGVAVFQSSVALLKQLLDGGLKTAVISASRNCRTVLEKAGLLSLFGARVDGIEAAELGLPGKPAPDTFLEGARRLGVEPKRAVVVEDAISGVQAGRAGGFGLVIGVDRHGESEALRQNGADIVVSDLGELLA